MPSPKLLRIRFMVLLIIGLMILMSCARKPPEVSTFTPTSSHMPFSTSTASPPTTKIFQIEQRITPTVLPSALPVKIVTATPSSHDFRLPDTISETVALFQRPLCQFPCFLGISPGETSYQAVVQEMGRLATTSNGEIRLADGGKGSYFRFLYPQQNLDLSLDVIAIERGVISTMLLYRTTTLARSYSIQQVLELYGEPTYIWVFTLSEPYGDGVLDFDLILDYSSQGFLLAYKDSTAEIINTDVQGCFTAQNAPEVYLWAPSQEQTFQDIAPIGEKESLDAKEISEVLNGDASETQDLLTRPDGFCLSSPVEKWKDVTAYIP